MDKIKDFASRFDERLALRKKRRSLIERARQQEIARRIQKEKDCA